MTGQRADTLDIVRRVQWLLRAVSPGTCVNADPLSTRVPSADINKDGRVNIQDLSIAGGNFDKVTPQPW